MYNSYRIYFLFYKKSLSEKKNLLTLNKRLEILEETICQTPTADLIEEYTLIKREIETIYRQKAIRCIIRSRCKLIEEFERLTKYFLSLEKAKQKIKHIQSLRHNGTFIYDQRAILDLQTKFYKNLYLILKMSYIKIINS